MGPAEHPKGKLIFVRGHSVNELDLKSRRVRVLYKHPEFLNEAITVVNGGFVIAAEPGDLYFIDMNGRPTKIGRGARPVYLVKHRALFFYGRRPNDNEARLFSAQFDGGVLEEKQMKEIDAGPFGIAPPVLKISEDEILFYRPASSKLQAFVYNAATGAVKKLEIMGCRPVGWRSSTKEVLCSVERQVWLWSIDGTRHTEIPELNKVNVGVVSKSGGVLLGSRARYNAELKAEVYDLVLYDFGKKQLERIAEGVPLAAGSGVWLE